MERRVKLATLIDASLTNNTTNEQEQNKPLNDLKNYQLDLLHHQVSGMNLDNFIVRPKRKSVEPFMQRDYWDNIDDSKFTEVEETISSLPTEASAFNEDEQSNDLANRFDNLVLNIQLSLLEKGQIPGASRLRVMEFGQRLESKTSIPAVQNQLALIQLVQSVEFWQAVDLPTLENMRRKLRNLLFALDKIDKEIVYTNFDDEIENTTDVTTVFPNPDIDLTQYRRKTELYIQQHQEQLTIQKLKRNKQITQNDLDILEKLLLDASGIADAESYREKVLNNKPLGSFIRELIGLDKQAAKEAFSDFLDKDIYNSQQIDFVDQIINYLLSNGILEIGHIFESPFTDLHNESAYGIFEENKVVELFGRIRQINSHAVVEVNVA